MEKKIANIIEIFLQKNSVVSLLGIAEHLVEKGCVIREKAKLVRPTYIQGRKFDKFFIVLLAMEFLMAELVMILTFAQYAARR